MFAFSGGSKPDISLITGERCPAANKRVSLSMKRNKPGLFCVLVAVFVCATFVFTSGRAVFAQDAGSPAAATEGIPGFYSEGVLISVDAETTTGIINIGSGQGLVRGAKLVVVRPGDRVVDPVTGELIRVTQVLVGEVEVVSVDSNVADVKLIRNPKDIRKGDSVRRHTSPPSGVVARPVGFRKVEVSWKLQVEPETKGFNIYRSETQDGTFSLIGEVNKAEQLNYIDKHSSGNKMEDSKTYYYKVATVNTVRQTSPMSEVVVTETLGSPAPPPGFAAESGLIRSVPLHWTIHENEEVAGYKIYRGVNPDGPLEMITDIKSRKETAYHDRNGGTSSSPKLEDSTTYFYSITAYSPYDDEGEKSEVVSAVTADPPTIPTGFEAKGWQPRQVPLKWEVHTDENVRGYIIYRSDAEEGPYSVITDIKGREKNSYVDGGGGGGFFSKKEELADAHVYFYKIQSYNWVHSLSQLSEPISVMTKPAPIAPEEVKTTSNRPKHVPVSWRKNPDVSIKLYQVFRSDKEDGEFRKIGEVPADKNHYVDEKVEHDSTYYYKIRAVDKSGIEGEFSAVVSAQTKKVPSPVRGLNWAYENGKTVLKWEKNPEVDIAEYIIYTKSFFGWQKTGATKETSYVLEGFKSGSVENFAVSAIDADKLESKRSESLTLTFP